MAPANVCGGASIKNMKRYVYVLQSLRDQKHYIGRTSSLERRIDEHNQGIVKSTKNRRPLKLIYHEIFSDKISAGKRERFFKTGKGREFIKSLNVVAAYPSG